jgi:hypothetical protein
MNNLEFLSQWYQKQCNGDWEHQFGVRINTIDNPGWELNIDLAETEMEELEIEYKLLDRGSLGWHGYSIKNKVFHAAGDPQKLDTLFYEFRAIAEKNVKTSR